MTNVSDEVLLERARCAALCLDLETRWRRRAAKMREEGVRIAALALESAADGLLAVRTVITSGAHMRSDLK